jgi:hypothetical protein
MVKSSLKRFKQLNPKKGEITGYSSPGVCEGTQEACRVQKAHCSTKGQNNLCHSR